MCGIPDFFATTKPLPVHARARVVVRTDDRASAVRVTLCGRERSAARRSPRRWVVRVPAQLGRGGGECEYNDMSIDFESGRYAGDRAVYTFNGRLHRH